MVLTDLTVTEVPVTGTAPVDRLPLQGRSSVVDLQVLTNILLSSLVQDSGYESSSPRDGASMLQRATSHDCPVSHVIRVLSRLDTTLIRLQLRIVIVYILLFLSHFVYSYGYFDDGVFMVLCLFNKICFIL